jgi:rfaE bifunctional protein nucleotidyltransferase chain/domain
LRFRSFLDRRALRVWFKPLRETPAAAVQELFLAFQFEHAGSYIIFIEQGDRMRSERPPEQRIFKDVHEVKKYCDPLRAEGKTLVTTNGCFDIVHSGHVLYLTEAAQLGDLVVVGVNADATVARLKGKGRPVRDENDRVRVVAALGMVDGAFVFREDDPRSFLEILRPDVHVKGGDYTEDIIERETVERHGGRMAILSFAQGFSTTSLVRKIRTA